jgi:hypothetical protein
MCSYQCIVLAGAAGLATALRGTVQEAVDAYQHQQESISLPLSAVLHNTPISAAAGTAGSVNRAAAAAAATVVASGAGTAAGAAARNAAGQPPGSSKGITGIRTVGSRGEGAGLTPGSAAAAAAAGVGASTVEIAADSSSVGSLGGTPLFRGVSNVTHRSGSGNMSSRLAASHHSSSWDDFEAVGSSNSAAL